MNQTESITEQAAKETINHLFPGGVTPHVLTEGKSYGTRRAFSDEKQTLMNTLVQLVGSLKGNLDQELIKDSVKAFEDLKDEFRDAMMSLLKQYQAGDLAADQFEKLSRAEIKTAWEDAYQAGVGSIGNPFGVYNQDLVWLKGADKEEFGYLKGFVQDMEDEEGTMSYEDRMGMYVDTIDHAYNHGKVEGSPDGVSIEWVLGAAEHCDDCVELAANSPYTKENLPTVPGAGDTQCLSNCRCELIITPSEELPHPGMGFVRAVEPKALRIPGGKDLPTYQEYEYMSGLSAEIDRLRGLISATSGDVKKDFIATRRDINAELIDFMDKNHLYYVPKSNYFQGGETPFLKESLNDGHRPGNIPEGYRSPSEKEKSKIDSLLVEVNNLRYQIASGANGHTKDLISQRHRLTEQAIHFMERHKIYYIPKALLPSKSLQPSEMLCDQLAGKITSNLFGHR